MSYTAVELCAQALVRLGATPIASFADPTEEARMAARIYPLARAAFLASYPWSFTIRQIELDPLPGAPVADAACAFALPAGCLRVVSAGSPGRGRGATFAIRGNEIHTNVTKLVLTYQAVPDEAEIPAWAASALVARLAAELCMPLTENTARAEALARTADQEATRARLIDGQQATPPRIEDFSLIQARFA